MENRTLESVIALAVGEANRKLASGLLIKVSDDDFDFMDKANYVNGDPETIYSLISLYGDVGDGEIDGLDSHVVSEAIEDKLREIFPDYI